MGNQNVSLIPWMSQMSSEPATLLEWAYEGSHSQVLSLVVDKRDTVKHVKEEILRYL